MLITESRLRRIIHDEINEMYCRKSYKNYTFINEESSIVGDALPIGHWAQYVNLLNPIDAYNNYTEQRAIANASKELAAAFGKIPLVGTPGIFTGAIFDTIDGNYKEASIKLIKTIIDTVVTYYCAVFIKKYLRSFYFFRKDMLIPVGAATLMASKFADIVIDQITTKAADYLESLVRDDPHMNQNLWDAVYSDWSPDVIRPIIAARTESIMKTA